MKKIIALLLAMTMIMGMVGCGTQNSEETTETVTQAEENAKTPEIEEAVKEETAPAPEETAPAAPTEVTFVDSYGDTVTLPLPIEKVCIMTSGVSALFKAWGQMDKVVACSDSYVEEFQKYNSAITSAGAWNALDPEAVIKSGATVVFGWKNYTDETTLETLKAAGVQCVWLEVADASKNTAEATAVAQMLGIENEPVVREYLDKCAYVEELLATRLPEEAMQKVLFYTGTLEKAEAANTYKSGNNETDYADMLLTAGGINIAGDNEERNPAFDLEAVITMNPDIVLRLLSAADYAAMAEEVAGGTAIENTAFMTGFKNALTGVAAVDADKYMILDFKCQGNAIGNVAGTLYIAKYLYPNEFADVDVAEVYNWLHEYFDFEYLFGSNTYGAVYGPGVTYEDGTPVTTEAKK